MTGLWATLGLQSSTATALLTASFVKRALIDGQMAQIVLLGANVGTALTALVVSTGIEAVAPILVLIGYAMHRRNGAIPAGIGSGLIGVGLMLISLALLDDATAPIRNSEALAAFLSMLDNAAPVALVLAAGLSRRMGPVNKLLAEDAAGRPMIARTVDHVLASRAEPVIVVTGHERERVEAALAGRPVRFVHAPDHAEGLSASLRAGLGAVPAVCEGALVCLGDMPLVGPGTLDRILDGFDPAAGRSVVQPVHEGQPGNPVLWGREFFTEIGALTGDRGARGLLALHAAHLAAVPVTEDSVLRDFDTPEALERLDAPA